MKKLVNARNTVFIQRKRGGTGGNYDFGGECLKECWGGVRVQLAGKGFTAQERLGESERQKEKRGNNGAGKTGCSRRPKVLMEMHSQAPRGETKLDCRLGLADLSRCGVSEDGVKFVYGGAE